MPAKEMCSIGATCDNDSEEITVYPLGRAACRLAARGCAALSLSAIVLLAGCHNFFVCEKASCPTSGGGGGSTTSDWVYVSNATAGTTYISAYDIGNGSLAAISGSPYNIGFAPAAMVVSPNNTFLYAATTPGVTNPGIYMFAINSSTGALSSANGGNVLISTQVASMDISPDGNFLFVVDSLGAGLTEYQINTSTGLLTLASTFPIPPTLCPLTGTPLSQTCTVRVAPSGEFVVASLGSAGTIIYPYTSASGITSTSPMLIGSGSTTTNPSGDFSVTLDKNNYIYIARTAALAVYQITDAAGDATLQSTATFSSTATPRSVALSLSQNYVYTANQGAGNISAFSIAGAGALTQVSGSPFAGPANVSAIGTDKSGSYMIAVGFNASSGLQLFTIGTSTVGTPGALTLSTSAGTGTPTTPIPAVLALSH
jgi:6-phosphogluconolactonase (cycloisomerase 2 family)